MDLTEHGEAAYPVDAWVEIQYNRFDEEKSPSIPKIMNGLQK